MSDMDWVPVIAIIVVCVLVGAFDLRVFEPRRRLAMARRRHRFRDRGESEVDDWYETHFEPEGLSFAATIAIASLCADAFGCHPTNFSPSDGLQKGVRTGK
jgi:hypothetical protein